MTVACSHYWEWIVAGWQGCKICGATRKAYKSRASFERHYLPRLATEDA